MHIEKLGLRFSNTLIPITKRVEKIVLHHPAHPTWTAIDIHNYHRKTNGWDGIGYNYVITKDGRIQEGRGRTIGAHVKGWNDRTIGVTFLGNFEVEHMTDAQVNAGAELVAYLVQQEGLRLNDVVGHRDLAPTACPGKNFRMDDIKQRALEIINPKTAPKVEKEVFPSWAATSIQKAIDKKVMTGFEDGTWKPNEPVTRAQMASILDRLGLLDR